MPKDNHSVICEEGLLLRTDGTGFQHRSSCDTWSQHFEQPVPLVSILAYLHWTGERLALAAEHPSDVPKLEKMRQTITEEWFGDLSMEYLGRWNPGVLPGFANLTHPRIFTGAELEKYLDQENYGSPSAPRLFGALLFNSVGGDGGMGATGKWDPWAAELLVFGSCHGGRGPWHNGRGPEKLE
ncbi:ABCA1 [Symbiodinium sp. CCMP2592]|nr:ABCA1 [Symbiodinium sp. CCMP2592]